MGFDEKGNRKVSKIVEFLEDNWNFGTEKYNHYPLVPCTREGYLAAAEYECNN